jgi:hypothetical protein
MKTIAQQLNVTKFPFEITNEDGLQIYRENSDGYWIKTEYNERGKLIYHEDSDVYWNKRKYDEQYNQIYFEDSNGFIIDNRPKAE